MGVLVFMILLVSAIAGFVISNGSNSEVFLVKLMHTSSMMCLADLQ